MSYQIHQDSSNLLFILSSQNNVIFVMHLCDILCDCHALLISLDYIKTEAGKSIYLREKCF